MNSIIGYYCEIPAHKQKQWYRGKFLIVSKKYFDSTGCWDEGMRLDLPDGFNQLAEGLYSWSGKIKDGCKLLENSGYVKSSPPNWL